MSSPARDYGSIVVSRWLSLLLVLHWLGLLLRLLHFPLVVVVAVVLLLLRVLILQLDLWMSETN